MNGLWPHSQENPCSPQGSNELSLHSKSLFAFLPSRLGSAWPTELCLLCTRTSLGHSSDSSTFLPQAGSKGLGIIIRASSQQPLSSLPVFCMGYSKQTNGSHRKNKMKTKPFWPNTQPRRSLMEEWLRKHGGRWPRGGRCGQQLCSRFRGSEDREMRVYSYLHFTVIKNGDYLKNENRNQQYCYILYDI